jgi:hypothetical protein
MCEEYISTLLKIEINIHNNPVHISDVYGKFTLQGMLGYMGTLFYQIPHINASLGPFHVTAGSTALNITTIFRESGSTLFSSMYCS